MKSILLLTGLFLSSAAGASEWADKVIRAEDSVRARVLFRLRQEHLGSGFQLVKDVVRISRAKEDMCGPVVNQYSEETWPCFKFDVEIEEVYRGPQFEDRITFSALVESRDAEARDFKAKLHNVRIQRTHPWALP